METENTIYKGYKIETIYNIGDINSCCIYDVNDHKKILKCFHCEDIRAISSMEKSKMHIDNLVREKINKMVDAQLENVYFDTIGYYPSEENMGRELIIEVLATCPSKLNIYPSFV